MPAAAVAPPEHLRLAEFTACRRRVFYPKTDLPVDDARLRALRQQTDEQLGLTDDAVRAAFAAVISSGSFRVCRFPEQGTFHRLFLAELDDGRRWLGRFNVTGEFWGGFTLHAEQWAATAARQVGVPAAEVLLTDTTRRRCPFDFQITACLPGQNLGEFDGDEPTMRRLLRELGATLARLHGRTVRGFGWPDVRPLADAVAAGGEPSGLFAAWPEYLLLQLDRHIEICQQIGAMTTTMAARARNWFDAMAPRRTGFQPVLLHGDPGSHNARTDGRAITALLDWEDCLFGDPVYEIAFWATFHPERRHDAFLDGYRAIRELPADFGAWFWLYFLRVALAKTVHRHRFGYADAPGRPPAAGRIALALQRLEETAA